MSYPEIGLLRFISMFGEIPNLRKIKPPTLGDENTIFKELLLFGIYDTA